MGQKEVRAGMGFCSLFFLGCFLELLENTFQTVNTVL